MSVSASAPPPLERHHHRLLHQIVFPDRSLDHPRHLIGGASSAGRDRNFDGLCWAPRAAIAGALATTAVSAAAALLIFRSWFLPYGFVFSGISRIGSAPYTAASGSRVQASREL